MPHQAVLSQEQKWVWRHRGKKWWQRVEGAEELGKDRRKALEARRQRQQRRREEQARALWRGVGVGGETRGDPLLTPCGACWGGGWDLEKRVLWGGP